MSLFACSKFQLCGGEWRIGSLKSGDLEKKVKKPAVEGPIEGEMREEIMEAFKYLKIGMSPGPSEVYAEMILASGNVGIRVLM